MRGLVVFGIAIALLAQALPARAADNDIRPFFPVDPTVSLTVGSSSSEVALTVPSNQGDAEVPSTVRVLCAGTQVAFIEFGSSDSVTASTSTSTPMLANDARVFLLPRGIGYVAAIAGSSGTTCYFTSGHGS